MIDKLLSFIAPHHCYGCLENGAILCPSCYYDITEHDFGACAWCLAPAAEQNQCRPCERKVGTSGTWVVGERHDALKRLVGNYKYESAREAAEPLVKLLDERIAVLPAGTVVCAVPTIGAHVRQRGFDHAAVLAQKLAERRDLTYTPLLKRRHQRSQHELKRTARDQAAREAFAITTEVPGSVLLVDDILTTGATLKACVKLLQAAGAQQIFVGVIARQPLDETPPPLVK